MLLKIGEKGTLVHCWCERKLVQPLWKIVRACSRAQSLQSCLTLCDRMNCSHQAPLSMGFSRQEYWSRVPSLSLSGFSYFLHFKSEFCNKEFMI